jgi:hypothetical protein
MGGRPHELQTREGFIRTAMGVCPWAHQMHPGPDPGGCRRRRCGSLLGRRMERPARQRVRGSGERDAHAAGCGGRPGGEGWRRTHGSRCGDRSGARRCGGVHAPSSRCLPAEGVDESSTGLHVMQRAPTRWQACACLRQRRICW